MEKTYELSIQVAVSDEEELLTMLPLCPVADWVETSDPPYQMKKYAFFLEEADHIIHKDAMCVFVEKLEQAFGEKIEVNYHSYDAKLWKQVWDEAKASSFATAHFLISDKEGEVQDGLQPIHIQSAGAFGDGQHLTTRLIMMLMEKKLAGLKPKKTDVFLDLGSGTGLLAIAGVKLGFQQVVATDCDPVAIDATKQNVNLNKVSEQVLVSSDSFPQKPKGGYRVIVSNILSPELDRLLPTMSDQLGNDGLLFLTGFNESNEGVLDLASALGLELKDTLIEHGWKAVMLQKH